MKVLKESDIAVWEWIGELEQAETLRDLSDKEQEVAGRIERLGGVGEGGFKYFRTLLKTHLRFMRDHVNLGIREERRRIFRVLQALRSGRVNLGGAVLEILEERGIGREFAAGALRPRLSTGGRCGWLEDDEE